MIEMNEVASPGLMISQTWPRSREKEGDTLTALETGLKEGFFTSFQTVEIPFAFERRQFARIVEESGITYEYCAARILNENGYNLSDMDAANRNRSCNAMIKHLDDAREAGADSFAVISGPAPKNPEERAEALESLTTSLRTIALEAAKSPALKLTVEPLDVAAHKKRALGFSHEAIDIVRLLSDEGLDVALIVDTAHSTLNGENPVDVLREATDLTSSFHFCNCVTDPAHRLYGDRHIKFGEPGVLGKKEIGQLMKAQTRFGYLSREFKRPIMCEVLLLDGKDSAELMRYCREVLEEAWSLPVCEQVQGMNNQPSLNE